jgi:fibro-slime domain-containing protein
MVQETIGPGASEAVDPALKVVNASLYTADGCHPGMWFGLFICGNVGSVLIAACQIRARSGPLAFGPNLEEVSMARTRTIACLTASGVAAVAGLTILPAFAVSSGPSGDATIAPDSFAGLPATLELAATIRDFSHEHPDFQSYCCNTTVGLVENQLGPDGVPVVSDLRGMNLKSEFRDSSGRNINPALFNANLGDREGELTNGGNGNGFSTTTSFDQWYRDVEGVNMTKVIPLTLRREEGTNRYVFDSASHAPWGDLGGFFPINGELMGDYGNWGKNFHFTTEVRTQFVYQQGSGQVFTFSGDDDVWVFIDGQLVIDLGGVHARRVQTIELDRLTWLEDGETYPLDLFHAERRTSQSNFRIETNIRPYTVELPQELTLFD